MIKHHILEEEYVQQVYDNIADNFSKTRYKVWETVAVFLDQIPSSSLVLDAGCGNGKNILYRSDLDFIGIDKCSKFVEICCDRGLNAKKGCITELSFKDNYFDSVICIAVIHHLETSQRRLQAIMELIRVTKKNGKIFISLWTSVEESIQATSNECKNLQNTNDFLIPWKIKNGPKYFRYYHLTDSIELEEIIKKLSPFVTIEVEEKYGNFFLTLQKK